jgi:hypothetical protein
MPATDPVSTGTGLIVVPGNPAALLKMATPQRFLITIVPPR